MLIPTGTRVHSKRKNFFMIENEIFDRGIAAKIGAHAFSLYSYLVRKTNQDAHAWPSQSTMAEATGMSKRSVDKCLKVLEEAGLIARTGWRGQTREIEVFEASASTIARGAIAPDATVIAPGAIVDCATRKSTVARGADNKETVDKDTVINTQDQESAELPLEATAQPVALIPLLNKTDYPVFPDHLKELQEAFPAVNVRAELKRAALWCKDNPAKRKTKNGVRRFLSTWMERQQNRGGARSSGGGSKWTDNRSNAPDLPEITGNEI